MLKIVSYIILFLVSTSLIAQDYSSYMMVMVKQKKSLNMARMEPDFQHLADNFERIADANADQWHPLYYAAFCYVNMSLLNPDGAKKEAHLDRAQGFIDRALEIYPDESELYALQALLYQARMQVGGEDRLATYSEMTAEALNTAKDYDPGNPRVYYLLGLHYSRLPEDAGGGMGVACMNFKMAMEKYSAFIPQHVLSPSWGGEQNNMLYNEYCAEGN